MNIRYRLSVTHFVQIVFFTLLAFFVFSKPAHAATYPISELGNCASQQECFAFCQNPLNERICREFARAQESVKGVTDVAQQPRINALEQKTMMRDSMMENPTITYPVAELNNCQNATECRQFCTEAANYGQCISFARSHGLRSYAVAKEEVLEKAREALGCTSVDECLAACAQPENRDTCRQFAREHGLYRRTIARRIMRQAAENLGCTTQVECKTLCQDDTYKERCQLFARRMNMIKERKTSTRSPLPPVQTYEASPSIGY